MQTFQYVRHKDQKEDLLAFLSRRFPYQNMQKWKKSITTGAVKVNDRTVPPMTILKTKDIISYERPRSDEPEIDPSYEICFEDDFIMVVVKNGNIPISESGKYYRNTLLYVIKETQGIDELYAVHRLDKETSGLLVVAKDPQTARILGDQFFNQIPQKTYHAILRETMNPGEILVDAPIRKTDLTDSNVRIRQVTSPDGKPSKTLFEPLYFEQGLSLARIRTFSGRTHQIRCHAEHIGHPILGDKLYGQSDERFLELLYEKAEPVFEPFGRISRQLLHASELGFDHPKTGEPMRFRSDFRPEFSKISFLKNWMRTLKFSEIFSSDSDCLISKPEN